MANWQLLCWLLLLIQHLIKAVPLPLSKLNSHLAPFENGCLVTFEVMPETLVGNILPQLKLTKTASVSSLNECAFVCYQNFCSAAIFEFAQPTSRCHLQIGPGEICNRRLQRHYSFRNSQRAIISCVRCSGTKPVTVSKDAELPLGATTPLPPQAPFFQSLLPSVTLPLPLPASSNNRLPALPPAVNPFTVNPATLTASTPPPIDTQKPNVETAISVDDDTVQNALELKKLEEKEHEEDEKKEKPKKGTGKGKSAIEEEISTKKSKSKKEDKGGKDEEKVEKKRTKESRDKIEEAGENKIRSKEEKKKKKQKSKKEEAAGDEDQHFAKRNLEKLTEDLLKHDGEKWRIAIGNNVTNDGGDVAANRTKTQSNDEQPKKLFKAVFSLDLLAEMHSRKGWDIAAPTHKVVASIVDSANGTTNKTNESDVINNKGESVNVKPGKKDDGQANTEEKLIKEKISDINKERGKAKRGGKKANKEKKLETTTSHSTVIPEESATDASRTIDASDSEDATKKTAKENSSEISKNEEITKEEIGNEGKKNENKVKKTKEKKPEELVKRNLEVISLDLLKEDGKEGHKTTDNKEDVETKIKSEEEDNVKETIKAASESSSIEATPKASKTKEDGISETTPHSSTTDEPITANKPESLEPKNSKEAHKSSAEDEENSAEIIAKIEKHNEKEGTKKTKSETKQKETSVEARNEEDANEKGEESQENTKTKEASGGEHLSKEKRNHLFSMNFDGEKRDAIVKKSSKKVGKCTEEEENSNIGESAVEVHRHEGETKSKESAEINEEKQKNKTDTEEKDNISSSNDSKDSNKSEAEKPQKEAIHNGKEELAKRNLEVHTLDILKEGASKTKESKLNTSGKEGTPDEENSKKKEDAKLETKKKNEEEQHGDSDEQNSEAASSEHDQNTSEAKKEKDTLKKFREEDESRVASTTISTVPTETIPESTATVSTAETKPSTTTIEDTQITSLKASSEAVDEKSHEEAKKKEADEEDKKHLDEKRIESKDDEQAGNERKITVENNRIKQTDEDEEKESKEVEDGEKNIGKEEVEKKKIIERDEAVISKKKKSEEDIHPIDLSKKEEDEEKWAKEHGFDMDQEKESGKLKMDKEQADEKKPLEKEAHSNEDITTSKEKHMDEEIDSSKLAEEARPRISRAHAAKTEQSNGTLPLVERSIDSLVPNKGEPEIRPVPPTIKLENGCFITFQAEALDKRPAIFKAPFELELEVESVEICAVRCYQDGCTGALYHARNKTCVLGYDDKHFCSAGPIISRFRHLAQLKGVDPLWLHCVNCRPEVNRVTGDLERPSGKGSKVPSAVNQAFQHASQPISSTRSTEGTSTSISISTTQQPISSFGPILLRQGPNHPEAAIKISSTTPSTTIRSSSTITSTLGSTTIKTTPSSTQSSTSASTLSSQKPHPTSTPNLTNIAVTTLSTLTTNRKPAEESSKVPSTSTTTAPIIRPKQNGPIPETIKLDHGCFVTFQAEPLVKRPSNHKAPFELKLDVESIEVCAIRCYQDGCTGALYHAESRTCELSYEDKHFCSNAPIISRFAHLAELRSVNPLWIHCVNCRPEVNRKTGQLDDKRQ